MAAAQLVQFCIFAKFEWFLLIYLNSVTVTHCDTWVAPAIAAQTVP